MGDRVELTASPDGVRLTVRVKPGGRRDRLIGPHGGALKLEVAAPPERGKANAAVAKLLAGVLGVGRGAVEITSGASGRDKGVMIAGAKLADVARALAAAGIPTDS